MRNQLSMCVLMLACTGLWAQEESVGAQLAESLSHGQATLSAFGFFDEDPDDDVDYPVELLIKQDIDLSLSEKWSLISELEYRADNRHFTAGVIDDWVEESERRYHFNPRELYLRFSGASTDFTIGKQVFAWGKADGFNPTDNLNPYDYLDFLTAEKIGVLSAAVAYTGNEAGFDLVFVPLFTPARIPGFEDRWFAPPDLPFTVNIDDLRIGERLLPEQDLENAQVGLRLWATRWGFDVAVTAYQGFDSIPAIAFALDLQTGELVASPAYNEITEYGLSVARVFGPTSLHFEGSYRDTEEDFDDDFVSYVFGLNRSFYVGGAIEEIRLIAEYVDEAFIEYEENDRRFTTDLSRPFRDTVLMEWTFVVREGVEMRVAGAYNLEEDDYLVQPLFAYDFTDNWKMEAGLDLIDGDPDTFWGNWENNDRAFIHLDYFF